MVKCPQLIVTWRQPMRYISNIILKGLAAILPVGLTLYLIYWF